MAHDLVLKAVDEGTAAQLEAVAAVGAAGKGHAVHRAGIVDGHGVAVGSGPAGDLRSGGVLVQQAVDLALHLVLGGLNVRLLQRDGRVVLRQGDDVQRFHAGPVAVFVQAVAVGEVLVIVVGRGAQIQAGALAGSAGRSGLAAARHAQSQRSGADKAERFGDELFQKNTSCCKNRRFFAGMRLKQPLLYEVKMKKKSFLQNFHNRPAAFVTLLHRAGKNCGKIGGNARILLLL